MEENIERIEQSIIGDLSKESAKLCACAETNYPHREGRGSMREDIFRQFLRDRFPATIDFCKGIIQDSDGRSTSEFDVLIFDPLARLILSSGSEGRHVLPVEAVFAAIELRSNIDSAAVTDATKKITELAALKRYYRPSMVGDFLFAEHVETQLAVGRGARDDSGEPGAPPIPVHLIGFESASLETIARKWDESGRKLNSVLCLGQYHLTTQDCPLEDKMLGDAALAMFILELVSELTEARGYASICDAYLQRYWFAACAPYKDEAFETG